MIRHPFTAKEPMSRLQKLGKFAFRIDSGMTMSRATFGVTIRSFKRTTKVVFGSRIGRANSDAREVVTAVVPMLFDCELLLGDDGITPFGLDGRLGGLLPERLFSRIMLSVSGNGGCWRVR